MAQSNSAAEVDTRHFARVFVDSPGEIPPESEAFKSDRGYYYRLNLQGLAEGDAATLVEKASETHRSAEVVGQVVEDGTVVKERRYVESVVDVPDGYSPQRGPQGGIYYETEPMNAPGEGGAPEVGDVTEEVGYSGEPVLAVQFEDIGKGDRIAFEQDDGTRDMGEVKAVDTKNHIVLVESGDGETQVAAARFEMDEEKADSTLTTDTHGAHNAVYGGQSLPDECRLCGERDRQEGSMMCAQCDPQVEKEDLFGADVFRVLPGDGDHDMDADLLGIGVDFPNHDVYVDWRNESFPDELDNPHVSVYGSIEDLEQATGNRTEHLATVESEADGLAKMAQAIKKDCDGHHFGPEMAGGYRLEQGEALCEVEGETFRTDEGDEPVTTCPICGEGLGDPGEVPGPNGETGHLGKQDDEAAWTYYYGPQGGEGWMNVETGEVRYQKQRPGPAPEGGDGYDDWLAEGWTEPPDDFDALMEGQTVEARLDSKDEHVEATYAGENSAGYPSVKTEGGSVWPIDEEFGNKITAVEDVDPEEDSKYDVGRTVDVASPDIDDEDHPDYYEETGEITDVQMHDGDILYEVSDGDGVVINEFYEDELEAAMEAAEDPAATDDILDDIESEVEEATPSDDDDVDLEPGDTVNLDITEATGGHDDVFAAEYEPVDGDGGYRVVGGPYAGSWFAEDDDEVEVVDDGSDDVVSFGAIKDGFDSVEEVEADTTVEYLDPDTGEVETGEVTGVFGSMDAAHVDGEEEPIHYSHMRPAESDEPSADIYDMVDLSDEQAQFLHDENLDIADPVQATEAGTTLDGVVVGTGSTLADGTPNTVETYIPETDTIVPLAPSNIDTNAAPDSDVYQNPEEYALEAFSDEEVSDPQPGNEPAESSADDAAAAAVGQEVSGAEMETDTDLPEGIEPADPEAFSSAVEEFAENNPDLAPTPAGAGEDGGHDEGVAAVEEWTADYDMSAFDPDDVEKWGDLHEFDFPSGITAAYMEVGALPSYDGEGNEGLVFKTEYADSGEGSKPGLGHRQMVTYTIGSEIGGQMPEHVGHAEEQGWVVAEGVEGEDVGAAPQEYLDKVDPAEFYEQAAIQIILGNNDAHMQNVKVTPDGSLAFHDIDHSAGDIASDFVGNKPSYDSAIDRVLGELERSGTYLVDDSPDEMKQKLLEHAEQKANEVLGSFTDLEPVFEDSKQYDPEMVENIKNNIENLAEGNITWP